MATVQDIDTKKIFKFLKSLNDTEYIYLRNHLGVLNGIKSLIQDFNLSKEEICESFRLDPKKYKDFVVGNYTYTLMHIAILNDKMSKLRSEGDFIEVANKSYQYSKKQGENG